VKYAARVTSGRGKKKITVPQKKVNGQPKKRMTTRGRKTGIMKKRLNQKRRRKGTQGN